MLIESEEVAVVYPLQNCSDQLGREAVFGKKARNSKAVDIFSFEPSARSLSLSKLAGRAKLIARAVQELL
jgi:hypothetical protein